MAIPFLPKFFTMQATVGGPYFCPVPNPPVNKPSGLIRADESQILRPRAKFEAEISETGDARLVHIRSCHNNKYWVPQRSGQQVWISASADKPEEDQTNPECTLFRTTSRTTSSGKPAFELYSFGMRLFVLHNTGTNGGLTGGSWGHTFPTVNWSTLLIFPSQVTFQSQHLNDNYLCSRVLDRWYNYHRFESGMDLGNKVVAHDLFPTNDGDYRIRNVHFGMFWRYVGWIWADAASNDHSNDTRFSFVKVDDKTVALRSRGNNFFCIPDSRDRKENCLRAAAPSITNAARLTVEERVLRREISNITYRLNDTRIYQEQLQEVTHQKATNDSPDTDDTMTLRFSTTESETTFWSNSLSFNYNVTTTLKATIIPKIVEGEVTSTIDFNYNYEWREEKTKETTREASYTVIVPPLTTKRVTLLCTTAFCDVPFSYVQNDLHPDGNWVSTNKDDGIFTGINAYNYYFHSAPV